jgi:hypothetical protein
MVKKSIQLATPKGMPLAEDTTSLRNEGSKTIITNIING